MSYDFFLGRPKNRQDPAGCISGGNLLDLGEPEKVARDIEQLTGPLQWAHDDIPGHGPMLSSTYRGTDTWYEFILHDDPVIVLKVRTSHRTRTRELIPKLCSACDLYAFDPQTGELAFEP